MEKYCARFLIGFTLGATALVYNSMPLVLFCTPVFLWNSSHDFSLQQMYLYSQQCRKYIRKSQVRDYDKAEDLDSPIFGIRHILFNSAVCDENSSRREARTD